MFVIIPGNQYHHHNTSMWLYSYSTLVPTMTDSHTANCAELCRVANNENRGMVLTNSYDEAYSLAEKYGGVVTDLRKGTVVHIQYKGHMLEEYTVKSSIYNRADKQYAELSGETPSGVRLTYRVRYDGLELLFAKHVTDLPEVIEVLGEKHYVKI